MYEVFAIAAGVLVGLVAQTVAPANWKVATLILGSTIVGAIAAFASGELLISWTYLVFDVAQVLLAACATAVLLTVWRFRAARLR